jgi:hypothetical protein
MYPQPPQYILKINVKERNQMDEQTIGLVFALIGVGATFIYIALGLMGVNVLKEIRDRLNNDNDR